MDYNSIVQVLEQQQVEYVVCVPCREISGLLKKITGHGGFKVILPSREDEGLGIMMGLQISGKNCLGLFQDVLLGNSQNAIGMIARCTEVKLTLWLASRAGKFLKENLVHEYITGNFANLASDMAISTQTVHLNMSSSSPLPSAAKSILARSFDYEKQSLNVVQLVIS